MYGLTRALAVVLLALAYVAPAEAQFGSPTGSPGFRILGGGASISPLSCDGTNCTLTSSAQLCWSTDTGLERSAAGVVEVTDCSTGVGTLRAATIQGNTDLTLRSNGGDQRVYLGTSAGDQVFANATGLLGASDNTKDLGESSTRWRSGYFGTSVLISGASVTAGSGTGVTVNSAGQVRTLVYKVTIASTNCIAAALTCDVTIATLPAKTFLRRVWADLTTTYACTATCTSTTLSGTLGTTAGGAQVLATMDLDAATAVFGDADAELGTAHNAAARSANGALFDGVLGSWTGTTTLTYRITSGTGNLGDGAATNLSQGTIVFYLTTDVHP